MKATVIFESYMDDFDENDIEDVYYNDDDEDDCAQEYLESLDKFFNAGWRQGYNMINMVFYLPDNQYVNLMDLHKSLFHHLLDSCIFIGDFGLTKPILSDGEGVDINKTFMPYQQHILINLYFQKFTNVSYIRFRKVLDIFFNTIRKFIVENKLFCQNMIYSAPNYDYSFKYHKNGVIINPEHISHMYATGVLGLSYDKNMKYDFLTLSEDDFNKYVKQFSSDRYKDSFANVGFKKITDYANSKYGITIKPELQHCGDDDLKHVYVILSMESDKPVKYTEIADILYNGLIRYIPNVVIGEGQRNLIIGVRYTGEFISDINSDGYYIKADNQCDDVLVHMLHDELLYMTTSNEDAFVYWLDDNGKITNDVLFISTPNSDINRKNLMKLAKSVFKPKKSKKKTKQ